MSSDNPPDSPLDATLITGLSSDADGSLSDENEKEDEGIISERAHWFTKRAGTFTDATSQPRYLNAVDRAANTPDDPRKTLIVGPLIERFYEALQRGESDAIALDAQKNAVSIKGHELEKSFFGAIGRVYNIESIPSPYLMLALHIDPGSVPEFDLNTAVLAYWQNPDDEVTVIEASKFFPGDNLLVGRITEAGYYRALAMPRHPLTGVILRLLASYFSYLRSLNKTLSLEDIIKQMESLDRLALHSINSSAGENFATFIKSVIEQILKTDINDPVIEPPLLKLWRLSQLSVNGWECLGPFSVSNKTVIGIESTGRVTQIDTHPRNADIVIAAAAGGGVWRTNNAGANWYPLMEGEPTLTMGAVAFAPSEAQVIYAASGEDAGKWNPAWPGAGIYRSDDGGRRWVLTSRVTSSRFSAIVVHPYCPYTLYVAGREGLHKSTDGGCSWITNPGLLSLFDGQITDVVLDYDDPDRVYIGVYNLGILRSVTAGESTAGAPAFRLLQDAPLPTACDAGWIKLAIGRNGSHRSKFIVAKLGRQGKRIFITTNGGDTWREKTSIGGSSNEEWTSVIAVDPSNDCRLYAGGSSPALNFSDNQGDSWHSFLETFSDQQDIAFDYQNTDRVYLANDGGVYKTLNKGSKWVGASGGMAISQVYDLDITEQDHEVIACGTQDTGFYYRNGCGVWIQRGPSDTTQVAIDPTDSRIIYFIVPKKRDTVVALNRSLNSGETITERNRIKLHERSPLLPIIKLHPDREIANPDSTRKIFLCGSHTFFFSPNAGKEFRRVDYKSGKCFFTDGEITALEYAPGDHSILYLGTSSGTLYKASGGGKYADDWTRLKEDFPRIPISSIGIDRRDPDHVWIVFAGRGVSRSDRPDQTDLHCDGVHVFKTVDGGITWANASGRIAGMRLPDVPMSAVALDGFDRNVAYVGTDVGVFRTSDGGTSWLAFQHGLPRSPVTELRLNHRERILFAATMGRGVYRRKLD